jgi:hypothetical protein
VNPGPGTICAYETRSNYGEITIAVPQPTARSSADYWKNRESYFRSFPGSAQAIPGIGEDAWLAGGGSLYVLIRENEHFIVMAQMYQPTSKIILIELARPVVERF